MAGKWTCNDCGSATTTRKVDATSMADAAKQYVTVPYLCSNSQCPNQSKKNQSIAWCTEV